MSVSDVGAVGALLDADEPDPVELIEGDGASPFLLTCDHAGRLLPRALGTLGLSESELQLHIAWDIGAAGVTRRLAAALSATAVLQRYSRLVIDCNRPLGVPSSIATVSEHITIAGNQDVSQAEAARRAGAVFAPYHARIVRELDARASRGQATVLVTVHSFTPRYFGNARKWHAGVLYQRDARLGHAVLGLLRAEPGLDVGENEPYAVSDATDYAVVEYGEKRGLLHVELEIRQDLIAEESGQREWAERLGRVLREAIALS